LLCCLSFETWLLLKRRKREGVGDIMDGYFYMAPSQKFGGKKWHQNNLGSKGGGDITRPIVTIEVTYIIVKNKLWRTLTICIRFYWDMKLTSKTVVP
jgi:hypothetical protein